MPQNNDVDHADSQPEKNGHGIKAQFSPIMGETGQWTFDESGLPNKKGEKPVSKSLAKQTAELKESPIEHEPKPEENANGAPSLLRPEVAQDFHTINLGSDTGSESDDEFKDAQSTPNPEPQEQKATPEPQAPKAMPPAIVEEAPKSQGTQPKDESQDALSKESPKSAAAALGAPELSQITEDKELGLHDVPPTPGLQDVNDISKDEPVVHKHTRDVSVKENPGISEWSHQSLAPNKVEVVEPEEDEWQDMPAYAPYDIYDDDNRLVAREAHDSEGEGDAYAGLGGAGKGYTRVQLDEDAQSATSLDENTKYLFKEVNGGTGAGEEEDDEQRDALSQMQATKDLLTEGQRVAYVGMTRLILSAMLREQESMVTKTTKKETQFAAEAMQRWSQQMMVRLYAHMDISTAEQLMVEQLAEHGVIPSDLSSTLMQNARVKNPMAETENASEEASKSKEKGSRPSTSSSRILSPRPSTSSSYGGPISPRSRDDAYDTEEPASVPPPYVEHEGIDLPEVRTPSQLPTTKNIDIDLRWTVLCDLFLTLIADSVYDARSRVLLERVGDNMSIDWIEICRFEKRVTDALEMQQASEKENWNEDEHKENRRKMALKKRYVMMGLATVGGGLVIGLSAGLLAPVIGAGLAAGFTTIGVAGTGGFLAGAGGAAIITSAAATSGGVIAVRAANRRTGAVKTFEYRPLHNNKRVNLIVTVSGWMTGKVDDVRLPYSTVDPVMGDIYSVLWEPEMLQSMGDTINILATEALTQGLQQVLGSTLLIGLMAALQLPVVLTKLAYLIDNPWTVSLDRANAAGLILADSLIDRNLGTRPITFVGYSLGSRVIFSCLRELARKGAYGLVQNVYLFGSPIVAKKDEYLKARAVVAGRFVNGYATNDWILGYLFRLTSGGISRVAGLAPVLEIPGLENLDVTEFVPGHMAYRTAMPRLLREVGWVVESDEFTEIEDPDPENHQQRQRELINEIEEARKEFEKEEKKSKGKFGGLFSRKKKPDKQAWETYEESKTELTPEEKKGLGSNDGVLFDVDAIRAELANEHVELDSEHIEVRELKSTLPPMKLDLKSPSFLGPRSQLRATKSVDQVDTLKTPTFQSSPAGSPRHSTTFPAPSPRQFSSSNNPYKQGDSPLSPYDAGDGEMEMTFDTAYKSPPRSARTSISNVRPPSPQNQWPNSSPNLSQPSGQAYEPRPSMASSNTMPLPTINLGHNAWADEDEDFGEEKEIEMTFA